MVTSVKKNGRPPLYTKELADEVCNAIATTQHGLEFLCKTNKHWPSPDTIHRWIANDKNFCEKYAQAKVAQTEMMVGYMYDIIEDSNPEHAAKTRLLVDTIKWKACKLVPKVYGDRVHNDVHMTIKQVDAIEELE